MKNEREMSEETSRGESSRGVPAAAALRNQKR